MLRKTFKVFLNKLNLGIFIFTFVNIKKLAAKISIKCVQYTIFVLEVLLEQPVLRTKHGHWLQQHVNLGLSSRCCLNSLILHANTEPMYNNTLTFVLEVLLK